MQAKDSGILGWLRRDRLPSDLYELLGSARLDPDVAKLRQAVRLAARDLSKALNEQDPKLAERAARLQTELARADRVLGDPVKLGAYRARMVEALRRKYEKRHGTAGEVGSGPALRAWLAGAMRIHPHEVDALVQAMRAGQRASTSPEKRGAIGTKPQRDDDPLAGWTPPVDDDPTGLIRKSRQASKASERRLPTKWVLAAAAVVGGVLLLAVGVPFADRTPPATPSLPAGRAATNPTGTGAVSSAPTKTQRTTAVVEPSAVGGSSDRAAAERRPLDLRLLPPGSRMLFAVRPATFGSDPAARDLVRGLGPWADEALAALERFVRLDLAEISHALIGLIPGSAGDAPRLAAVLRLTRDIPRSQLLEAFGNPEPATTASKQYYVDSASYTAYYFADPVTIAILPERFAREVLRDVRTPLPTSREIEALVERSDREALFSVLFDVPMLRDQAERVLDADDRALVRRSLDLLGEGAVAGLLSLDTGESFRVQLLVRTARDLRPAQQRRVLDDRLRHLPYDLLEVVQGMNPPRRTRRLIGRFPAMMKALAVVLEVEVEAGNVVARVNLPERAGPNLALAGRLTWQEYQASFARPSKRPSKP